jgi:hypothetical protein
MQPNLSYVKDRLLSAGRHLQKGIATLEDGETYRTMHDAQNQLALALATVVTMEREGTAVTIPTPVTDAINEHDRVYALIRALRDEADEQIGLSPRLPKVTANRYTASERGTLLRAAALLESTHPSLFDDESETDDSCG